MKALLILAIVLTACGSNQKSDPSESDTTYLGNFILGTEVEDLENSVCKIRGHEFLMDTSAVELSPYWNTHIVDDPDSSYIAEINRGWLVMCNRCGFNIMIGRERKYIRTTWRRESVSIGRDGPCKTAIGYFPPVDTSRDVPKIFGGRVRLCH